MTLNSEQQRDLRRRIDHLEQLHNELEEMKIAIRDSFGAAKSAGYDVKAMKSVLKLRMMEPEQRDAVNAHAEIVDAYRHALGLLADTPLGQAAIERATAGARA